MRPLRPAFAVLCALFLGPLTALATPGRAFDPATDAWSREALEDGAKAVKTAPLPTPFLGDEQFMRPFTGAHQAWFADGFQLAKYHHIVLPTWSNSLGRYHVTGQELLRRSLGTALGAMKPWRGGVAAPAANTAGTAMPSGDLTIYGNIHQFKNTANDVEYVIELLAVDNAGLIQFKLQDIIGTSGTAGMAVAGATAYQASNGNPLSAGLAMAMSMPTDRDQFNFYGMAGDEIQRRIPATLLAADKSIAKNKPDCPHSAAVPLTVAPAGLMAANSEAFGPTLADQVASYIAIVNDPKADMGDRRDRLRDLGKIGARAAVPVAIAIIQDDKADNKLQENAAWALGEIGHPDGLPALQAAHGVDGFNVKAAITKISEY